MYKTILYATDLSKDHYVLAEKAQRIAKYYKARLFLLHVIEPPPTLQLAQGLGFAEFDHPENILHDAQLVMGTLGEALGIPSEQQCVEVGAINTHVIQKVSELRCDLLLLGAHTHKHILEFFNNSAHTLLEQVPCDILLMK